MSHLSKWLAELRKKTRIYLIRYITSPKHCCTTYANWECGKANPDADSIMRIEELHNITIDELFGRNNPLESKLESIKVALADLPAEKQQEALDVLIDYTYFIRKHFIK